jgi:hypothetical protein
LSQRKHAIPAKIPSKNTSLSIEELASDSTNVLIVSTWRTGGEVMLIGEALFSPDCGWNARAVAARLHWWLLFPLSR